MVLNLISLQADVFVVQLDCYSYNNRTIFLLSVDLILSADQQNTNFTHAVIVVPRAMQTANMGGYDVCSFFSSLRRNRKM